MKQLKCLTLALSMAAGALSLTSCLGGNDDPYHYVDGLITKVNSFMGLTYSFTTPGQQSTVTPTEASIRAIEANTSGFTMSSMEGEICLIGYRWDPSVVDVPTDATNINGVELMYVAPLNQPTLVVGASETGSARDSVATTPIISLAPTVGGTQRQPFFFDSNKRDILMYVDYYIPDSYSNATSLSLTLVYYPDDPATVAAKAEGKLRLHLNYRVRGAENFNSSIHSTSSSIQNYFMAFRLDDPTNSILRSWGGTTPDEVEIVVKENSYSTKLDDSQTKENTYEVLTWEEYSNGSGR